MKRSNRSQILLCLALAAAGLVVPASEVMAQCPYSSIQTRVQLNEAHAWSQSFTLPQRETFRVGVFYNNTGQFASPSFVNLTVTRPDGAILFPGIGGYVTASVAGTYTVHGSCGTLSETATPIATGAARRIWAVSPGQPDAGNWNDFYTRLDKVRDAGATAAHLSFNWDIIEDAGPGQRDWSYSDNQVNAALARGLTPFAYTGSTATWALPSGTPGDPSPPEAFFPPSEARVNDFKNFHRDLAARYCGQVRYYEFWNEPNGCGFRTPSENNCNFTNAKMAVYVRWLKRWYDAMKQGCQATVLSFGGFDCQMGVDCGGQINTLYSLISANPEGSCLNNCFDAASIHPYGNDTSANALNWSVVNSVSSTLAAHGNAFKLMWLDEWAITNSHSNPSLVTTGLNGIESYPNAFQARYLQLTDADISGGGLMNSNLTPRASYWAFCNHARTHNSFVVPGRWKGEYYKNTSLAGTPLYRDDGAGTLYFNWGNGGPICDFAGDNFSARWTRAFNFPAGTYRFTTRTDDGVRLWVDNVLLIDKWVPQSPTVWMADRTLTSGNHTVRMEYFESGGGATAQLSWPVVSTTVCGNLTSSTSCNANAACQWFGCGTNFCLPKNTADPPTCTCLANTNVNSCDANAGLGCAWYYCKSKCLASGTSIYSVCGTGSP